MTRGTVGTGAVLDDYVESAEGYLSAITNGNPQAADQYHAKVTIAYEELKKRGDREHLLALLTHISPIVRQAAATHALEFAPDKAISVLKQLVDAEIGVPSLNAEVALQTWLGGTVPFEGE